MKSAWGSCLLVILMIATSSSAQAGGLLGFSVGGQAGISHTGGDVDESSFIAGGSTRLEILSLLTAELMVNYRKETIDDYDVSTIPIQASALITFLPLIYGTIGVGWYDINPDDDLTDQLGDIGDFSNAALHLGGGVSVPVSEKWNFIGDLRYVFLNYDIEDLPDVDSDADFYMLTGGLQYEVF
jgi:opacity protein-like surface antigen